MKMEKLVTPIDRLITTALKDSGKPLSTYRIAKCANVSWSTANAHCYKLKSLGVLDLRTVKSHTGQKKVFWQLVKE